MATEYKIANFNIMSWQDTDYDRNVNPTPLDVSVPKMLADGTIVYVSVPNLAKKKAEIDALVDGGRDGILGDFPVYVDSINGLDTNDGLTSSTPIKTLVAGFNKCQENSSTTIYLHGDQTHYLDASVNISAKSIYVRNYNVTTSNPVISNAIAGEEGNDGSTYGLTAGLYAYLSIYQIDFETATKDSASIWTGLLQKRSDAKGTIEVFLDHCDTVLGNTPLYKNGAGPQNCRYTHYIGDITNPNIVKLVDNEAYSIVDIALTALTLDAGVLDDLININTGVRKTW